MLSEASRSCDAPCFLEERPCVLLVDDDIDVAHTVSNILRQERYEVVVARGVKETLSALDKRVYDVVLLELALASADGLSLLTQIRHRAATTFCIVLTGYASLESAVAALRRGAY